jgi:hypothetical protein
MDYREKIFLNTGNIFLDKLLALEIYFEILVGSQNFLAQGFLDYF